jgi:hypothetical protein
MVSMTLASLWMMLARMQGDHYEWWKPSAIVSALKAHKLEALIDLVNLFAAVGLCVLLLSVTIVDMVFIAPGFAGPVLQLLRSPLIVIVKMFTIMVVTRSLSNTSHGRPWCQGMAVWQIIAMSTELAAITVMAAIQSRSWGEAWLFVGISDAALIFQIANFRRQDEAIIVEPPPKGCLRYYYWQLTNLPCPDNARPLTFFFHERIIASQIQSAMFGGILLSRLLLEPFEDRTMVRFLFPVDKSILFAGALFAHDLLVDVALKLACIKLAGKELYNRLQYNIFCQPLTGTGKILFIGSFGFMWCPYYVVNCCWYCRAQQLPPFDIDPQGYVALTPLS